MINHGTYTFECKGTEGRETNGITQQRRGGMSMLGVDRRQKLKARVCSAPNKSQSTEVPGECRRAWPVSSFGADLVSVSSPDDQVLAVCGRKASLG